MKYSVFLFLFIVLQTLAQSQVEIDASAVDTTTVSERYTDYSDQLLVKVMSVVKQNNLEIINIHNNQSLKLSPANTTSLGFGFNHKWLGLAIAFGLPANAEDKEKFGETRRFDFQLNIYSKKFVIDAFAQQYSGFYIANPGALTKWPVDTIFPQLDSMQTFSFGVGGYYVFNNEKLSYKAAYVRNAVQNKSAGSFLLGGFYNLDYAGFETGAQYSFIPSSFPQDVKDTFDLNAYKAGSFGVSFGYTYTFVFWKRFFINLSLIPGVGGTKLTIYTNGQRKTESIGAGRFIGRSAVGYENKHFLIGLTSYTTTGNIEFDDFNIKPSTSNVKFFFAKRFNVKRKKDKTPE